MNLKIDVTPPTAAATEEAEAGLQGWTLVEALKRPGLGRYFPAGTEVYERSFPAGSLVEIPAMGGTPTSYANLVFVKEIVAPELRIGFDLARNFPWDEGPRGEGHYRGRLPWEFDDEDDFFRAHESFDIRYRRWEETLGPLATVDFELDLGGPARDELEPLGATDLRATRDGSAQSWPLEVLMDGAAYSWRIHFPSDADYESSLVALREGSGSWRIVDSRGRLSGADTSLGLLSTLAASAAAKTYPSSASPLQLAMEEEEAYYFPGWTVKNFQLARGLSDGKEKFSALERDRVLEQILPSPSLVDAKEEITVMIALKRRGTNSVDGLAITTEAEYVAGERAFFAKPAYREQSYTAKALALFGTIFGREAGYQEYRRAAGKAYPGTTVNWELFDGDEEADEMKRKLQTHFLNTSLSATEYGEKGRVLRGGDRKSWFENQYGENRIAEVSVYGYYAYETGQPMLAASVGEWEEGYDYGEYGAISEGEGKELARAAMRNYSWGVEYYLAKRAGEEIEEREGVYEKNRERIDGWIDGEAEARYRGTNYCAETYSLDLGTLRGVEGLPEGWAEGLELDSPFGGGEAGNPLPYARGGEKSPRSFAREMREAGEKGRGMKYSLAPKGAGTDALGLLTSAIAQTSLMGRVEGLGGTYPGAALDEYERSGKEPSGKYRYEREDLEKISLVVPGIEEIRVGDLMVHYGEEEGESKDSFGLWVVVYAPEGGRPGAGEDPREYLKSVVVVGANEGKRQAEVERWAGGVSEDGSGWQLRRLVGKGPSGPENGGMSRIEGREKHLSSGTTLKGTGAEERARILLNTVIAKLKFRYERSYDHSSRATGNAKNQRWIPNTGQYLVLENLHLSAKNGDGVSMELGKAIGKEYVVSLGMEDRNGGEAEEGGGNIRENKGEGFELVAMPKKGFDRGEAVPIGKYRRGEEGKYEVEETELYTDESMEEYKAGNDLWIRRGELVVSYAYSVVMAGTSESIGIRPYAENIRPGDDIILTVEVKVKRGGEEVRIREKMEESEYLAVYDKKLLWRANLYIDEGVEDWNNQNPWNAPPDAVAYTAMSQAEKDKIKWWDASWGYNEWNRKYDGVTLGASGSDGKQVVTFINSPWTPVRTKQAGNGNYYNDRVAYDYEYSSPTFKAMDSPFDFIWKMNRQKQALKDHFSLLKDNENAIFPSGINGNQIPLPDGTKLTNKQLKEWKTTKAPYDLWKYYWKEPSGGVRAYIPGLGFRYHGGIDANAEPGSRPGVDLGFTNKASAGTDCIGYVQRTASYLGNRYIWVDCPTDFAEGRVDPDTAVRNTVYPVEGTSQRTIFNKENYTSNTLQQAKASLALLVPGDIFSYGPKAHIGIISKIDYDAILTANEIDEALGAISLIESTYTGPVNYVQNNRTLFSIVERESWNVARLLNE